MASLFEDLRPRRALEVVLLSLLCIGLSAPALLWQWEQAQMSGTGFLLGQSSLLILLCWSVHRFWGRRWGAVKLDLAFEDRDWRLPVAGLVCLGLLAALQWTFKDKVLFAEDILPAPPTAAVVLALCLYSAFFVEVVVRIGWMTLASGITGSRGRAVLVAAASVALLEQYSIESGPAEAGFAWWIGVGLLALVRETVLGLAAYRYGFIAAIVLRFLYSLRWLMVAAA